MSFNAEILSQMDSCGTTRPLSRTSSSSSELSSDCVCVCRKRKKKKKTSAHCQHWKVRIANLTHSGI